MSAPKAAVPHLEIRLLGELEVLADGVKLALPQSKKTRALLGYLLLTGQEHRRDRLCSLLWDVVDDPRAALRWSLSKLRELVDAPALKRLCSDREHVSLDRTSLYVDALEVPRLLGASVQNTAPQALAAARLLFRGELLEGIELADFHGFSAWLLAERSRFRDLHRRVLNQLIECSGGHPERVLPLIRDLVHIDPTDEAARAKLLEVLHATGAIGEAHEQARANQRLMAPVVPPPSAAAQFEPRSADAKPEDRRPAAESSSPALHESEQPLIGRERELAAVQAWLSAPTKLKAWLFEGEAGMGKSRLLRECERMAVRAGARAVRVRVPDVRPGWPYAALQALLAQLERGARGPLEQLVEATATSAPSSREELLQAVQAVLERAVQAHAPLMLLLDDVHHLDDASVELMHFCALNLRTSPIAFVLSARGGELHDRPSIARTLRALRREHILDELQLSALTLEQTQSLLAPAITPEAARALYEQCGGNPLFALLLRERHAAHALPRSIAQLVQDRIAGLLTEQADVLRWAAVLGATFHMAVLRELVGIGDEMFVEVLEGLERHGWLSLPGDEHARFVHQIVQRALYDQLSEPRKRLMHSKVAQLMAARSSDPAGHGATLELTALLAHHAVAGGDRALAVRACLAAGKRCLRVYAHADAYSLARRGLTQAQHLPEPDQTCLALELLQMQLRARRPEPQDELLAELVRLTERALDLGAAGHAHLGFHLRAYIKWQAGDPADAQRYSREVERISRMTAPHERAEALADSARCLAQVERDLSDAEAFVNEAELLADPDHPPAGLPLARGMLTLFRGDHVQAEADLERARQIAARAGNRLEEFYALEYCVYLELARERYNVALELCADLTNTAERLREGSELAFARAIAALVRVLAGVDTSFDAFAEHYAVLAAQDAKQRCAFLAAEAAHYRLAHGDHTAAIGDARRALTLARAIDRPTECALALSVIIRAELASQSASLHESCAALSACLERPVSALARSRAQQALVMASSEQEKPHGARDRRTRVRGTRAS
jgi:DNA-binding SARP family transcriptional activator/predicted ATPase